MVSIKVFIEVGAKKENGGRGWTERYIKVKLKKEAGGWKDHKWESL